VTLSFVPLLAPANQMTYDPQEFFNAALAIVAGVGAGALSFRLLPPLSPALRARRLLALSLRDMRHLAAGAVRWTPDDWKSLIYSRLSALPAQAEPLQRAQLLAALSLGSEIMRLRRIARRFDLEEELGPAFEAVARGDSKFAREHLAILDRRLAMPSEAGSGASIRLRGRGRILAMSELLTQHAPYFDSGPVR
ncbi:MAG TPA: FUSC family protein, partial [Novosphingobium sp.]|nr:FUSC family protein [Novosphingobium sp.]